MTNPSDRWAIQLHTALQRLRESEIDCAKAAANYTELLAIIHKRSNVKLPEYSECSIKKESDISCTTRPQSTEGTCRKPVKIEPKRPLFSRQLDERPSLRKQPLKKHNADIVPTSEQLQINQIQKRIKQYYKSSESIEELSRKYVTEKKKFVTHLENLNSATWKTHKSRNSLLDKLSLLMNET